MSVRIIDGAHNGRPPGAARERRLRKGLRRHRGKRITLGFFNNMGDGAHAPTERQYLNLLHEVGDEFEVSVRRYRLETLPRGAEAAAAIAATSRPSTMLRRDRPDALIVTGAEPKAERLDAEPFWRELAEVVDFARDSTHASYFSCLAAHAAVLRLDGIERRALRRKLTGVFTLAAALKHPLIDGFDWNALIPHSRWNTLDEAELTAKGYEILTRSAATGPDLFIKRGKSLLTFSQGHPEYDADTLGKEFRRDLRLYAEGKRANPPLPPQSYFMPQTEVEMMAAAFRIQPGAEAELGPAPRSRFSDPPPWRRAGALLARNWLGQIAERKNPAVHAPARFGG
jgi:homoserine O-succinyltransferase/O-acetyltransferase